MTPEQLGNFTYGYIGAASLFTLPILYAGSVVASPLLPVPNLSTFRADARNEFRSDWPMITRGFGAFWGR